MKNRYQRMNEFFVFLKNIIKENPDLDFNKDKSNVLYSILVKFDVDREMNNNTLQETGIFENWVRRMSKSQKISISIDPTRSYLEFNTLSKNYHSPKDFIFIQIPLDKNHIEQGINLIIDFLNRNKIEHKTSISKSIKSDNVVIKIINPDNLDKICDFISQTDYIKEGLIKSNPFLFEYKNLAITTGNKLSYNTILTEYIRMYLSKKKEENELDSISSNDFIVFLNEYYNKVFINRSELDSHIEYFSLTKINDLPNTLVNFMNLTELMIQTCDEKYSLNDLLQHFKEYKNNKSFNNKIVKFQQFRVSDETIKTTNELLAILYEYLTLQYDEESAIANLELYITQGRSDLITRKKHLREKLSEINFTANMLYLLQKNKEELRDYLQQLNIIKKTNEEKKQEIDSIIIEILNIYCNSTESEKNKTIDEVIILLKNFIKTKDYRFLTRTNNIRGRIISSFFLVKLNNILESNNINLEDYIKQLAKNNKIGQERILENAIISTYKKYERLKADYESGNTPLYNDNNMQFIHTGRETVIYAMNEFLAFGRYSAFTRENNARQELEKNITPMEAVNLMRKALKIPSSKNNPKVDELNYLVNNYIELILNMYQTKKILN